MGRVTAGVRGINLREGDWVEEVATFDPTAENDILVVTDLGFGKRTPVAEFRLQHRGGYGLKLIQLTAKNGTVAGIRHVHETDQVLMVTERGMLIRINVDEIRADRTGDPGGARDSARRRRSGRVGGEARRGRRGRRGRAARPSRGRAGEA